MNRIFSRLTTTQTAYSLRSHNYYSTMTDRLHRVTMFKLPKVEDQQKLLEQYRKLEKDHQRNGKQYILSMAVGPAEQDPRSQGFTFVSKTEFANADDMKYYDEECPAHNVLKGEVRGMTCEGIMTVYFRPQAVGGVAP